jgi:EGF domain/Calcium-binding EGF domain
VDLSGQRLAPFGKGPVEVPRLGFDARLLFLGRTHVRVQRMMRSYFFVFVVSVLTLAACSDTITQSDDSGIPAVDDAGAPEVDAGVPSPDAGPVDAGEPDAGQPDAGAADSGVPDAGMNPNDRNCTSTNGGCDALVTCTQVTPTAVTCGACPSGYSGNGLSGCVNVDECAASPCAAVATCTDTPGSFTCACSMGYSGDGGVTCDDVNECPSACDPRTTCTNTIGSFSCSSCPAPTIGQGALGCTSPLPSLTLPGLDGGASVSSCAAVGIPSANPFPFAPAPVLSDPSLVAAGMGTLTIEVLPISGTDLRLRVLSIGSAQAIDPLSGPTDTRLVIRGRLIDLDLALHRIELRSFLPGTAVFRVLYCRDALRPCAEMRILVTFAPGNAIDVLPCDPPPALLASSDDGTSQADSFTSDFSPTLTVASSASTTTWLRDDVVVATNVAVVNGTATFTDQGTPAPGLHSYSVIHGTRTMPSARRWIFLSTGRAPPP